MFVLHESLDIVWSVKIAIGVISIPLFQLLSRSALPDSSRTAPVAPCALATRSNRRRGTTQRAQRARPTGGPRRQGPPPSLPVVSVQKGTQGLVEGDSTPCGGRCMAHDRSLIWFLLTVKHCCVCGTTRWGNFSGGQGTGALPPHPLYPPMASLFNKDWAHVNFRRNIGKVQHNLEILTCGAPIARSVTQITKVYFESQLQVNKWFLCH